MPPPERELSQSAQKEDDDKKNCGCPPDASKAYFIENNYRVNGFDTIAVFTEVYGRDWVASINDALQGTTREQTGWDPEDLKIWENGYVLEGIEFDFLSAWSYAKKNKNEKTEVHYSPKAMDKESVVKITNESFWHVGRSYEYFRQQFKKIHNLITGKEPTPFINPSSNHFAFELSQKRKRKGANLSYFNLEATMGEIVKVIFKILSSISLGPDLLLLNGPYRAITKSNENLFLSKSGSEETISKFLKFWLTEVGPSYSDEKLHQFRDDVIWETCKPIDSKNADENDKTKCKWAKEKVC